MTESPAPDPTSDNVAFVAPQATHRGARLDEAWLSWRTRRAHKAGYAEIVLGYAGYGGAGWARVLGRVLLASPGWRSSIDPAGMRGWRNFTSVPVPYAEVEVTLGEATVTLRADRGGLIDGQIAVDLVPGKHVVSFRTKTSEPSSAEVTIAAADAEIGVLSDIDDTVMVTALPRPLLAAWHTFVVNEHARATTPGMPVLYERLLAQHREAPMIYLSTGAWNVAPTLTRFLSRNLYPAGSLLLTDWGPTADSWFRSGREHKEVNLRRLAQEFPDVQWLLFGDDGQHDEEIYAAFAEEHPDRVRAICIRQLSPGEAVLAGSPGRSQVGTSTSGVPWFYAPDGAAFARQLEDHGLLQPPH